MGSRGPLPQLTMSNDPLRVRSYLHLDEPPRRNVIAAAVADPAQVARWQFLPMITRIKVTRKIKRQGNVFIPKEKKRPISYASHRDAALYAFYAAALTRQYEHRLELLGLSDVVTAFRTGDGRCNIHFAREAFEWIDLTRPCVALAYDISGFFDNLDHRILRDRWADILDERSLPADHYALFRSLTRYTWVSQVTLYAMFGISPYAPKASGRTRICSALEFRNKIVRGNHLNRHLLDKGIPQGTPISAVLSNIYMLDFDRMLSEKIKVWGGLYRRYCDDVLCIVPPQHAVEAKAYVEALVASIKLEVQPEKLEECYFGLPGTVTKPALQYLGLTFDGRKVRLRNGGVAKFYSRMRQGVRQAHRARTKAARMKGVPVASIPIKRGKLNRSYLYVGPRNFVTYATRAARLTLSEAIGKQISRRARAIDEAIGRVSEAD